jgi:hypothetical protein
MLKGKCLRTRVREYLGVSGVGRGLTRLEEVIADRLDRVLSRPPPSPPPSFVSVLVEARARHWRGEERPIWLGCSARVSGSQTILEIVPQLALNDGRIIVFADLERVAVGPIFVGNEILHAAPGECPVGTFDAAAPGVKIRVLASLRSCEAQ